MVNTRYYYLQQMGIDPWVLRPVIGSVNPRPVAAAYPLTILGEAPKTPSTQKLFKNMLKSIALTENDVRWHSTTETNSFSAQVIWVMGASAWHDLFNTTGTLHELRGRVHDYQGAFVVVSYALDDLLQHPYRKKESYADLLLLNGLLINHDQRSV